MSAADQRKSSIGCSGEPGIYFFVKGDAKTWLLNPYYGSGDVADFGKFDC